MMQKDYLALSYKYSFAFGSLSLDELRDPQYLPHQRKRKRKEKDQSARGLTLQAVSRVKSVNEQPYNSEARCAQRTWRTLCASFFLDYCAHSGFLTRFFFVRHVFTSSSLRVSQQPMSFRWAKESSAIHPSCANLFNQKRGRQYISIVKYTHRVALHLFLLPNPSVPFFLFPVFCGTPNSQG